MPVRMPYQWARPDGSSAAWHDYYVSIFGEPLVKHQALYYPYMIPPDPWLKQALLMNDSVSTIVHPDLQWDDGAAAEDPRWEGRFDLFEWLRNERCWEPRYAIEIYDDPLYLDEMRSALNVFCKSRALED